VAHDDGFSDETPRKRRLAPFAYAGLSIVVVIAVVAVIVNSGSSDKTPSPTAGARVSTTTANDPTVSTTGKTLNVACFSSQRQTEDLQSPACVATGPEVANKDSSAGIADGKIRISYPQDVFYGSGNDRTQIDRLWTDLENYFNTHFMMYGRSIQLVPFKSGNSITNPAASVNPALQKADAVTIKGLNAFASLGTNYDFAGSDLPDGLADSKIISVSGGLPTTDEAHLASRQPYEWYYGPTLNDMELTTGRWICNKLAKGKADFAGGDEKGKDRKFGVIVNTFPDVQTTTTALDQELQRCGVAVSARASSPYTGQDKPDAASDIDTQLLDFKTKGVTSVICICHENAARAGFMPAASRQQYSPEWLFTSFLHNDFARTLTFPAVKAPPEAADQMPHAFGLSFRPVVRDIADLPVAKAVKTVDPDFDWGGLKAGQGARFAAQVWDWFYYKSLLVLATGIQTAGPNLTPETFGQGLQRAEFPAAGGTEGRASFKGRHTMVEDSAVVWWDANAPSAWGDDNSPSAKPASYGPGTWCYAGNAVRFGFNDVAKAPPPFTGPCTGAAGVPPTGG